MKSQNKVKGLLLILAAALVMTVAGSASADLVTLNPNGAGDVTNLALVHGMILPVELRINWGVNTTDDGDTSYVWSVASVYNTDLYNLTDVALSGTINSVTVYIKARAEGTPLQASARTAIKTETTVDYGSDETLGTTYATYSTTYATNPQTLAAWTWDQVNALQAGVSLRRASGPPPGGTPIYDSRCTLVWVVVDYTPSDYEGLSHGYWKNHPGDWAATGYSTSDTLESVFDIPDSFGLDDYTLLEALNFPGGDTLAEKAQILLRNAVASLLNAAHPNINYQLTVAEVIEDVNDALATEDADIMLDLEAILDGYNNLGGDISS